MAYYLDFGGNDHVEFPLLSIGGTDDFSLYLDIRFTIESSYRPVGNTTSATTSRVFIFSNGLVRLSSSTGVNRQWSVSTPVVDITSLKFIRVGGVLSLEVNGVPEASSFSSNTDAYGFETFGTHAGFYGSPFKLYNSTVSINSTASRDYNKQTLNGSNDTVLPDTVGGNDGTLIGFPTDNSQWVFFDDGGGTATLDANVTLPSLTATGNASATLPQATLSASINLTQLSATGSASATLPTPQLSAAITLPSLTAAGSASATLPNPTLSALITLPIITASGNVSASLPQPTLSASITLPTIIVSGNASATLPGFNLSGSITLPVITATGAAQATLPQPILTASVNLPTLTATGSATATEPSFTLSGNVTLPTFTVTGAASATLPQPTLSGNITLPSIQVSGFLVGGEVVITIDASTNINEPQLSTNITEPTLSTNISE